MTRDEDIRRLLLNVLQTGILRIRAFASNEDSDRCLIEADHIHNLPRLIRKPQIQSLTYYFDVERTSYVKRVPNTDEFEPDWLRLGELIEEVRRQTKSREQDPSA